MYSDFIHTYEHQQVFSLSEQELICLLKENNRLVDSIDLNEKSFKTGYYIGLSWISERKKTLFVAPKLDNQILKIDYLKMLSVCIKHPEVLKHTDDLFEIRFDEPSIKIRQQQDLITPLLIIYFLQLVHSIVRKGLKKGYYKVEKNLYSKVKGKILVANTLKQNILKSKTLYTICTYDEFGLNNMENRVIKKALLFVLRYLKMSKSNEKGLSPLLSFIFPAFEQVDENISLNEVKAVKHNPFYSEYSKAVEISINILKRFGFNINFIKENEELEVPPFWINMPKLYEIYILGKLKESLGRNEIIFQAGGKYGELDFLRITKGNEMVIDAKYKPKYKEGSFYDIDDIRQLSGYARDRGILNKLAINKDLWPNTMLNCLVVYPDQDAEADIESESLKKQAIHQFEKFYKIGVSIPTIK
jgi:5-methylcytosine-specific restriction enzyme subunit McrC